jgi:uncharacterized membrane protein
MPITMLVMTVMPSAQERAWDWHWELHPIWWPFVALAAALLLLILFAWALLHLAPLVLAAVAIVFGIRWLKRSPDGSRSDPAISVLRERYARGEVSKEEFDAKLRDLGGAR